MSHTPTTAAIVVCSEPKFANAAENEDPESVSIVIAATYNGTTSPLGERVVFSRNATQSEKQTAVRNKVNAMLHAYEPEVTLNNANIQIIGLPV
jgi:hypothetical protein